MKEKLKNIANLSTGYSFRSRLQPSIGSGIKIIQMKDLDDEIVCFDDLTKVDNVKPKKKHFVQKGDIIFRSRGQKTTAAIIDDIPESVVVAGPLIYIRITSKAILPEYLLYYINQPKSQSYFASRSKGTLIKMLNKQDIGDFEVYIPDLKRQKSIIQICKMMNREKEILSLIWQKRESYLYKILTKNLIKIQND
jgi:restriction endonuclease S subunit